MSVWTNTEEKEKVEKAAWHVRRSKGIGGSEIAIILGMSPYRTAYSLWLEKTGKVQPDDISGMPHVVRGILGEKTCRLMLERKYLKSFRPKEWQVEGTPFRATDDGYNEELETLLEIKCMGKAAHEAASRGEVPAHYLVQCQYNLFVSKAKRCLFVSFRPEDETMHEVEVLPDPKEQKRLSDAAREFWFENVLPDIPPALTDKDFTETQDAVFLGLADQYKHLKKMEKEINTSLTQIEEKLHGYMPAFGGIMGHGVLVQKQKRKGSIDYKRVPAIADVDLEQYRKPATEYTVIRIKP